MRKRCSICKSSRNIKFFYKKSASSDGYKSECRYCQKDRYRMSVGLPPADVVMADSRLMQDLHGSIIGDNIDLMI